MVKVVVAENDTLEVEMAGYTMHFYTNMDGKLVFSRWIGQGYRDLVLDPVDDAISRNPGDVSLEQNLTLKRLPESVKDSGRIRIVVWDLDPETKARSVHDIIEGTPVQIIRIFNKKRGDWAEMGCDTTARLEAVREEREGVWA